ncbi:MAG: knotted carbamoyltransferase YgeW [Phycisphaerae bacterium]
MSSIDDCIKRLEGLDLGLYNGDFLLTWDKSPDELKAVLAVAQALEELYKTGISTRVFDTGLAVSIFRDQSTRTRFSYASAASLLGLSLQELDEKKSQIAHGETVRETANMISFVTEAIGIRDDIFLGQGHKYMAEVAAAVDEGHREGVLAQRPAVVNLQCDLDHPTQSLSDLLHLTETFGSLEALQGKKIAMSWAYSPSYGKPLSVPQGIITLMTRFGMNVVLAHPKGYDLVPETLETAGRFAAESGGSFTQTDDMADAFAGADVVYPKSWAPLSVMQQRTAILQAGDNAKLEALEKECLSQNAEHTDWECTQKMMSLTKLDRESLPKLDRESLLGPHGDGHALYMHCLPADITGVSCQAGEVSAEVFERYRLATYHEASHKPFVIAAMILLARFEDPAAVLGASCGDD